MDNPVTVEKILTQIKKLDYEARLVLMQRLQKQLVKNMGSKASTSHRLTELSGLGSEIWKNIDVEQYLQQERQWDQ